MTKFRLILLSVTVFLSGNINGQISTLKDESQTRILSKKVAALFTKDSISEVFEQLEYYWPVPKNEIDNLESKTISTLNTIAARYGKSIGNEKVKEEKINNFALRETYLIRYSYHALRLIITYYKNNSGWIVNSFTWDDSFSNEFREN